jgi:hypothetical protein
LQNEKEKTHGRGKKARNSKGSKLLYFSVKKKKNMPPATKAATSKTKKQVCLLIEYLYIKKKKHSGTVR